VKSSKHRRQEWWKDKRRGNNISIISVTGNSTKLETAK